MSDQITNGHTNGASHPTGNVRVVSVNGDKAILGIRKVPATQHQIRILVDLDGVICRGFPIPTEPIPGVRETLTYLRTYWRAYIIVWSGRFSPTNRYHGNMTREGHEKAVRAFLERWKIPHDELDLGDRGKIECDILLDDCAVEFRGSWSKALKVIESRLKNLKKYRPWIK